MNRALEGQRAKGPGLNKWRGEVIETLKLLEKEVKKENNEIIERASRTVKAVLTSYKRKNIAFIREVCCVCGPNDLSAVVGMVVGLPMLGWAPPADGLMQRVKEPEQSIEKFVETRISRNMRLVAKASSSGDDVLDKESFQKTMDEVKAGVTVGPFESVEDVPFSSPCLCIRHGIWECHGSAESSTVRNIDDLLSSEQNSTCGTLHSHRPTDVDALVAQSRACAESTPRSKLLAWVSDFAKAFKQIPLDPEQVQYIVIVQYSPMSGQHVFFVTYCQTFGSKNSPLNFSRFPAVICELVAVLFCLAATHCVDDVIGIEAEETAMFGKSCWDEFMDLCGWLMSESKNTDPRSSLEVIGVSLNLKPFPNEMPTIMVTAKRLENLEMILTEIYKKQSLGCGEAASLSGKLGFTLSGCFGKVGRCRVRPIALRSFSRARKLDTRLVVCILWWIQFLWHYKPRPIPTSLKELQCVLSYSDGEGGLAGIGAALWCPWLQHPLAVYTEVPKEWRDYWSEISLSGGEYRDIYLIEALGPLLLLLTFPRHLKNCLWIHFIDNSAAEASLIRGSASKYHGDHVIGLTWLHIQMQSLWPYFDRVESDANPVDGLSRRKFLGPWKTVEHRAFPTKALKDFIRTCEDTEGRLKRCTS